MKYGRGRSRPEGCGGPQRRASSGTPIWLRRGVHEHRVHFPPEQAMCPRLGRLSNALETSVLTASELRQLRKNFCTWRFCGGVTVISRYSRPCSFPWVQPLAGMGLLCHYSKEIGAGPSRGIAPQLKGGDSHVDRVAPHSQSGQAPCVGGRPLLADPQRRQFRRSPFRTRLRVARGGLPASADSVSPRRRPSRPRRSFARGRGNSPAARAVA